MAEQWEMCETGTGYVIIYTPKGVEGLKYKEFIQRHKDHVIERNDQSEVVCLLLSDGWEPYTADSGNKLFRRKYQS